jgi:hypothetical protein
MPATHSQPSPGWLCPPFRLDSLLGYAPFVPTAFEMSWETPVVAWVISANDPRSVTVGDSYELVVNASSPCVALQ